MGRGLSALLSADSAVSNEEVTDVDIRAISAGKHQPRTRFDPERLRELAQSIKSNGIIQPLLLRRLDSGLELVAGERRWRAAQIAGLSTIPAIIRDIPDDKLFELALIENIQRQELNPIEEANAYKKLIDSLNLTQDEVAKRVGRDRTFITNYLRILKLPEDILGLVEQDKLSMGHARALLGVANPSTMRQLAGKILTRHWSVRETEQRIRGHQAEPTRGKTTVDSDPNIRAAESKLRTRLGRQVRILPDVAKKGGKIEIRYYDDADLDQLYRQLSGKVVQFAAR